MNQKDKKKKKKVKKRYRDRERAGRKKERRRRRAEKKKKTQKSNPAETHRNSPKWPKHPKFYPRWNGGCLVPVAYWYEIFRLFRPERNGIYNYGITSFMLPKY